MSENEIIFIEPHPLPARIAAQSLLLAGAVGGLAGGFLLDKPLSFAAFAFCFLIVGAWGFLWLLMRRPAADRVRLDHRGLVCTAGKKTEFIIPASTIKAVGVIRGQYYSEIRLWYDEQAFPEPPAMVRFLRKKPGELRLAMVGDQIGMVRYKNVGRIREFVQRNKIGEWRNYRDPGL